MVKAHHAKTVSMSLFDSDYKIDNSYANKDISETLFTLKNLISYSEISIKKKRTTVSPAIDYTFRKNVEKDSPPSSIYIIKKLFKKYNYLHMNRKN